MIETAILKLVWFLFIKGPLNLIAAFNAVLQYLTGGIINDLLFGSSKDFQWNNIPMQFWWFVVFAFCLFSLVFTIQIIILIFKEAVETKTKFIIALQNGLKAFIFMFLIPIFFFLSNYIIQNIATTITNNFGTNSNLADYLWHMGNPDWHGAIDDVKPGYGAPDNIKNYNMLAQIFGTWFMLFGMFIIGLALVQKIFELFFLFVISPIVMIVMVIDNGKAAFTWKDMVIAKFLAATATLIGYYVFISAIQALLASNLNGLSTVPIAKSLFIILALCGGSLATTGFADMIGNFVGESIGIKEGMASMQSTIKGGMMAMGAAKVTGRALGFMKNKRAKQFPSSNLGDETNTTTSDDSNSNQEEGINFSTFRNANTGLGSRTGIVGLTGLGIGAIGFAFGHMSAGAKRSWKSGNREGMKGKVKGVGRVLGKGIATPVVASAKVLGRGLKNTTQLTKDVAKNSKTKNINNHKNSLMKQRKKYSNKAQKLDNKIDTKNYSEKQRTKKEAKVIKHHNKAKKIHDKLDTDYN
ncbi:hypothetical protein LT335_00674 [Spiroplasma sp. JKS002669]|uniref:Mbov_0396 family ICE element transmembrane protein n=1 Tax=Spiroplasma attinicola TaxID=2904537 RepID=UPI002022EB51|nr:MULTISPECIES: hypothetical protein [unclassified Spiroplasma]MCL6429112.1 hypothetical protein [Spiroplasma sp. JKS002669]MCL8210384.1 hypothetical protein [Spiroplasma sp. JKS002671]